MSLSLLKNGVELDLQRIDRELRTQREKLTAEAARFDAWRAGWNDRQAAIDNSLARLRDLTRAAGR